MAFRVSLMPRVAGDADTIYRRVTVEAPFAGPSWYGGMVRRT